LNDGLFSVRNLKELVELSYSARKCTGT